MPLDAAGVHARLRDRFGDAVGPLVAPNGGPDGASGRDAFAFVAPARLVELCRFAKTEPALRFDCLSCLSGVDYPKRDVIEVVYHLHSYALRQWCVLKVETPRDAPRVPSVHGVWASAEWPEREVFDLLGVVFDGHPDLRRLLMPEDWPGHPLRKDFVEPEEYHGITTSRESLLKA